MTTKEILQYCMDKAHECNNKAEELMAKAKAEPNEQRHDYLLFEAGIQCGKASAYLDMGDKLFHIVYGK